MYVKSKKLNNAQKQLTIIDSPWLIQITPDDFLMCYDKLMDFETMSILEQWGFGRFYISFVFAANEERKEIARIYVKI